MYNFKSFILHMGLKYCSENDKRLLIITHNALIKILYYFIIIDK